jgi:polysaccharide export outer membrane protein
MKHILVLSFATALLMPALAQAQAQAQAPPLNSGIRSDAGTSPDYRLRLGDKLRIEVHKDAQLSQSVQIRPDGKITLPLVGDIPAIGRTPGELRDEITKELTEYVARPVVTVIVVEATAPVAYVVGEVTHPGSIEIKDDRLTVLQAIAMAGGLKDFADKRHIRVLRRGISGDRVIEVDYKLATTGKSPVYLQPGDTVVVPD